MAQVERDKDCCGKCRHFNLQESFCPLNSWSIEDKDKECCDYFEPHEFSFKEWRRREMEICNCTNDTSGCNECKPKENTNIVNYYYKIAESIAELTEKKNIAYGNSVKDAPKILKILYPDGVPVEKYNDMLTIVRILDKIKRISTDKDALGESPYKDIAGYCLVQLNEKEKEKNNA